MNIIAVDDEQFALQDLMQAIQAALPGSLPEVFLSPTEALKYAEKTKIDIAFLDIEMSGMNGLALAKRLKDICGKTNVVFATGHSEYAVDAFSVSASGYILKPVSVKSISDAMMYLRNPIQSIDQGLVVQTFGNFEVFFNGEVLRFPRSKAKELFAYLIHKKGTSSTIKEITALLFEDKTVNVSLKKQVQTIVSTMMQTLGEAGARDVIIKNFNSLAVDTAKINCDYYRFLQWDVEAVNSYTGEYMANYSWAEFTVGYLDSKIL